MPMLWEMFPNHPNLLAALASAKVLAGDGEVSLSQSSPRERRNVSIVENGKVVEAVEARTGKKAPSCGRFTAAEVWR